MSCLIRISISRGWSARRRRAIGANGGANASSQDRSPIGTSMPRPRGMEPVPSALSAAAVTLSPPAGCCHVSRAAFCAARALTRPPSEREGRQKGRERPHPGARLGAACAALQGRSHPFCQAIWSPICCTVWTGSRPHVRHGRQRRSPAHLMARDQVVASFVRPVGRSRRVDH